jgi:4-diphosphocytidyl-2-C-methyl-D-erythritol kinase
MVIKSYSKINLSLNVNSKRRKGLHEIQSLYCLINLFDEIKIIKTINKDKIVFKGPFKKFIKKNNNTVSNLLKILRKLNLISNYYSITVKKNIPVFGGLGGGTSNAAFILRYLLKDNLKKNILTNLESTIGTDLKLFLKNQGFVKNLKTIIEFNKKHNFYFVLIQPNFKCSTKKIYSKVEKFSKKKQFNKILFKNRDKFLEYLFKSRNDLQFIVERKYPIMKKLLTDIKNKKGCQISRMTGSGSVCYGLFSNKIVAKNALNKLKRIYPKFWFKLAKTV